MPVEAHKPTERGIMMAGPMVNATLADAKWHTRRVVSAGNSLVNGWVPSQQKDPEYIGSWPNLDFSDAFVDAGPSPSGNEGPYLKVAGGDGSRHRVYSRLWRGDRLWVRESWNREGGLITYRADGDWIADYKKHAPDEYAQRHACKLHPRWQSPRFMRRADSRLLLEITSVKVERVQDISEDDAFAEGVRAHEGAEGVRASSARSNFTLLWQRINGTRPGCNWADNPWVWVYVFRRVEEL